MIGIAVGVWLEIHLPAFAEVVVQCDYVEERRHVVHRIAPILSIVGAVRVEHVVVVKVVVPVVEELPPGRIVVGERVDNNVGGSYSDVGLLAGLVVELRGRGHVLLGRKGLVAIRALVIAIEPEVGLALQKGAGVDISQDLVGVEGAVGFLDPEVRLIAQLG